MNKVIVAPNLISFPLNFLTSIISALEIVDSSSKIFPSIRLCCSFAYWYSAFSDKSPWPLASAIAAIISGLSLLIRIFKSSLSLEKPSEAVSYTHLRAHET